jgi:hypothetical protein
VSVHPTPSDLDNTVTARWRERLIGIRADEKSHWRTKTAYYVAVSSLIAARWPAPTETLHRGLPHPDGEARTAKPITWQTIVAAVRPHGSRSTFYDVAGPHAKHPLITALRDAGTAESSQLAFCYQRGSAVEQLIDETKVWSYWPYRQGWLDQCRRTPELAGVAAVEGLVAVVAEWARRNPGLAHALRAAPPLCAVEDLVLVSRGQLAVQRAVRSLSEAIPRAAAAPGIPDGVFEPAAVEIGLQESPSTADVLLGRLAEQIYAMSREAPRLPADEADSVCELAAALMNDAVSVLATVGARS